MATAKRSKRKKVARVGHAKRGSAAPRKAASKAKAPSRKARSTGKPSSVRVAREVALGAAAAAAPATTRLAALQEKLAALNAIAGELRSRLTGTPADDDQIKPNLNTIRGATRTVEAQIAAATASVLKPPSDA